jgi:RNA polymerase sigma-70 factor (ECF subfamily)
VKGVFFMDDSQIVALYWNRNEAAIDHTDKKYGRYLAKIAYNILTDREDAQESVNDTYLAAWNSIPPHKPAALCTYLGKLTRRISIDLFRKKSSQKRGSGEYALSLQELDEHISSGDTTQQAVELQQLSQAIESYLRSIGEEARKVFIGRYYYLDPVKTIAGYCHISESKAKILLHRTRQGLWEYLQKEGFV